MFGKPQISPELLMSLGGGIMSGQNLGQGLGQGFQNASQVMAYQRQNAEVKAVENKTREWLKSQYPGEDFDTMTPDMMKMYASEALKKRFAPAEKPNIISAGNGMFYDVDKRQYIQPPADMQQNQNEYGLNPVWVRDPKTGQQKLMVTSKDGTTKLLDTQGMDPISPLKTIDTGTGTMLVDPRTAEQNTIIPKDIAGAKEQEVRGKTLAENKAQVSDVVARADKAIKTIDEAINSPGLESATGWQSQFPTWAGSNSANFEAKVKEIQGATFLEAYQSLKGSGQITEVEGQKAENAIANLSLSQSDAQMRKALADLKEVITAGRERAKRAAGVTTTDSGNVTSTGIPWKKK